MAFFLFYIVGYRKKTVLLNLSRSFPDLETGELNQLAKKYYRYLGDVTLETFKMLAMRQQTLRKRCTIDPSAIELFGALHTQQQSAFIVMGHHGNWEWAGNSCSLSCTQPLYFLYRPLANHRFDALISRMRQRHGVRLIRMKDAFRSIKNAGHETNLTAFIADQSPDPDSALWMKFLHQDTAVFKGVEKMAIKMNRPVIYLSVHREKRGYYKVCAELLVSNPTSCSPGEITRLHARRLEQDIIAQPETWLWSHKRWKHHRPVFAA